MFKAPFSFDGRIRRLEYGLSIVIYAVVFLILQIVLGAFIGFSDDSSRWVFVGIFIVLLIPLLWFIYAQGTKRCHDLGKSGWWQLIPFYVFWMLFEDGQLDLNMYGENPKRAGFKLQ